MYHKCLLVLSFTFFIATHSFALDLSHFKRAIKEGHEQNVLDLLNSGIDPAQKLVRNNAYEEAIIQKKFAILDLLINHSERFEDSTIRGICEQLIELFSTKVQRQWYEKIQAHESSEWMDNDDTLLNEQAGRVMLKLCKDEWYSYFKEAINKYVSYSLVSELNEIIKQDQDPTLFAQLVERYGDFLEIYIDETKIRPLKGTIIAYYADENIINEINKSPFRYNISSFFSDAYYDLFESLYECEFFKYDDVQRMLRHHLSNGNKQRIVNFMDLGINPSPRDFKKNIIASLKGRNPDLFYEVIEYYKNILGPEFLVGVPILNREVCIKNGNHIIDANYENALKKAYDLGGIIDTEYRFRPYFFEYKIDEIYPIILQLMLQDERYARFLPNMWEQCVKKGAIDQAKMFFDYGHGHLAEQKHIIMADKFGHASLVKFMLENDVSTIGIIPEYLGND